ncbi:MAG: Fe-S-containing hydro-lyase [Dehalococcoidia bacterium]|nr:Fe-S-containing hydro-lyase [Dehalococcoidia bacterium]
MKTRNISTPLQDKDIESLRSGDEVLLSGVIYTARDSAHKRMVETLERSDKLPFDLRGQVIYFTGPSPTKPGHTIGSAGPTTSYRMDTYSSQLIEAGLKGMIGKGSRSQAVKESMKKHKAVYFAAIGGAGALISKTIKKAEVIAYQDLGTEAIRRLEVKDFPITVINDIYGDDLYYKGKMQHRR